jgi:hypothetical protein
MTAEAELAVAKYCSAASAWPQFCGELLDRRGIAPVIFDTLSGVGASEDWALSAILSFYATRAHLERAVPRWYDNEPEVLAEFKKLRSLKDAAWWNALAASKQVKLREIAARNAATPAATLVTLMKDPESDVSSGAASNPSTPIEVLSTASGHVGWALANPRVPDTLVRSLLDRALAEGESSAADDCKKVLAARALRAKP